MKSKELMQIFELSAKIMSYYKNKDVVYALNDILLMCKKKDEVSISQQVESVKVEESEVLKTDFSFSIGNIETLSVEEIAVRLNDRNLFPNVDSLKKFANDIGLKGQSRVNRENLIYTIVKFVERSRIDKDISSRANR
ncbi:TPA: hypothetical protein ACPJ07_001464 [Vibrio diabolicus]